MTGYENLCQRGFTHANLTSILLKSVCPKESFGVTGTAVIFPQRSKPFEKASAALILGRRVSSIDASGWKCRLQTGIRGVGALRVGWNTADQRGSVFFGFLCFLTLLTYARRLGSRHLSPCASTACNEQTGFHLTDPAPAGHNSKVRDKLDSFYKGIPGIHFLSIGK